MAHYVAIIEDGGTEHASGVWFPDLPGCFSGGDSLEEALREAPEAVQLYIETMMADGKSVPAPRSITAIKNDPEWAADVAAYMVALIPAPALSFRPAAE